MKSYHSNNNLLHLDAIIWRKLSPLFSEIVVFEYRSWRLLKAARALSVAYLAHLVKCHLKSHKISIAFKRGFFTKFQKQVLLAIFVGFSATTFDSLKIFNFSKRFFQNQFLEFGNNIDCRYLFSENNKIQFWIWWKFFGVICSFQISKIQAWESKRKMPVDQLFNSLNLLNLKVWSFFIQRRSNIGKE